MLKKSQLLSSFGEEKLLLMISWIQTDQIHLGTEWLVESARFIQQKGWMNLMLKLTVGSIVAGRIIMVSRDTVHRGIAHLLTNECMKKIVLRQVSLIGQITCHKQAGDAA